MAGEIASAAITGGSGFLGNVLGWFSNKSTNKTNLKINQMNNEFNEKMMERQLSYNTEMWNKNNAYNDPSSQVERLKRAGINPVLAMQGNPQNTASSAMGVNPATASPAAPQQAWQPSMEGIAQGAQMLFERRLQSARVRAEEANADSMEAEAKLKDADLVTRKRENLARLDREIAETKNIGDRMELERERFRVQRELVGAQYETEISKKRMIDLQSEGIYLDNIAKSLQNINLPLIYKYNLAQKVADIALTWNRHRTEGYNQAEILQDIIESTARELGLHLDNQVKRAIQDDLIEIARENNWWNDLDHASSAVGNVFGAVGTFASGGASAATKLAPKPKPVKGFGK